MIHGLLGTDKDVEELARRARRAGWVVTTDGRTHLRWRSPSGGEFRSPLTGGRGHRQRVERRLALLDPVAFADLAPAVARRATAAQLAPAAAATAPVELSVCVAELVALAELLGELLDADALTADRMESAADEIRTGRGVLRDAEDALRGAARAARS